MTQTLIKWMFWHKYDSVFMAGQVWRAVKRADGLSLALSFLLGGHLVQTRTVDKLKWDLHSHVHSDVPDVPSSPCSLHSHITLAFSTAFEVWPSIPLTITFCSTAPSLFLSPSLSSLSPHPPLLPPSAFLALIKPSSAPQGWIVSLMDGKMEH